MQLQINVDEILSSGAQAGNITAHLVWYLLQYVQMTVPRGTAKWLRFWLT